MLKREQRKLDLSCLQYLTEEDLNDKYTSLDKIRKEFPHTKKSKLELYKLFYAFNCELFTELERDNCIRLIEKFKKEEIALFHDTFDNTDFTCELCFLEE